MGNPARHYSIQNTVKQALFLPTTREQKYKAKQVTDSFSQRAGDTLAGLTTVVVVYLLNTNIRAFALVSVAVLVVWLFVAEPFSVGAFRRITPAPEPSPAVRTSSLSHAAVASRLHRLPSRRLSDKSAPKRLDRP